MSDEFAELRNRMRERVEQDVGAAAFFPGLFAIIFLSEAAEIRKYPRAWDDLTTFGRVVMILLLPIEIAYRAVGFAFGVGCGLLFVAIAAVSLAGAEFERQLKRRVFADAN